MEIDPKLEQLGQTVFEHFMAEGEWPLVKALQRRLHPLGNVRTIAATGRGELLMCESNSDGRCWLTLRGLEHFDQTGREVENYLAVARLAARRYLAGEEDVQIDQTAVVEDLGLSPEEAHRVGLVVRENNNGIWSSAGFNRDGGGFHFLPSDSAWYFHDVHSLEDLDRAREKQEADSREQQAGRGLFWDRETLEPAAPQELPVSRVSTERLHLLQDVKIRELVEQDVDELNRAVEIGAWKSVGFLAGSCCEALLLDLLDSRPHEAREAFKGDENWRSTKGLKQLADAARRLGWLAEGSAVLIAALKHWRDLIHPWRAAQHARATRETALALVSLLNLLLAQLPAISDGEDQQ